ncbi:glycerophosphodiester phosphodiesterase family protein [Thermococcus sp. Bubb.Bath]|uniref:glycerophosphodiester phosphodiesterase family protein n=1 Tax=Thermococcus sp. Bubb.Bath TaxID=1638242 RepID=UPI00143B1962|nr:glycerophosphodiester phosphodiesterase family protein [Thermococcus sp. Bubb.Bath]NJF25944.1 glycerophosphodiester phosphodiesterase [Thermococcus sp. Bubb.Bath]
MVLLIGHRGFRGRLENTVPAFRRALRYADGIEFDVWETGDGKIVITHDGEVGGIPVKSLTLREVLRTDRAIPTLTRVLREFRSAFMDVDVKDIDAVEGSVRLVERFGVDAVFSADKPGLVRSLQKECPDCRVGFSITGYWGALVLPSLRGIYSLHVPIDAVSYVGFRNMVAILRIAWKRGLKIFLWNYRMDELTWVPRFLPFVDGVIADNPARMRKVLLEAPTKDRGGEACGELE